MKTAISVPNDIFERASKRASDLGMSRSEFFSRATSRYLEELEAASVTHQIDRAVAILDSTDESTADAVAISRGLLAVIPDEW